MLYTTAPALAVKLAFVPPLANEIAVPAQTPESIVLPLKESIPDVKRTLFVPEI